MENNSNNNSNEEVAVIGIGFRLPGAGNGTPNELWNQLLEGFDGVVEATERWSDNFCTAGDVSNKYAGLLLNEQWKSFDPLFFGISPKEAETIDPQQRLLLKCVWEALEDSHINPLEIRGSNTSVYAGCSTFDYQNANSNSNEKFNIFGFSLCSISNRISHCYDLHGTSMTIDTACSSSLNAISMGYKSIACGESSLSIACGSNLILDPKVSKSFSHLGMLSKSGGKCKSFDEDADGYVRAEGCGVVIMKSLKQAIADSNNIYCVINGASSNADGAISNDKSNFLSPSKSLQAENIKLSLLSTNGKILSNDIDYIEAHGTGTPTGDPIELEGISIGLNTSNRNPNNPLLIGTIKSNIGHCEAGSGVASLIKCCLMFKHECFVPNIHFTKPNPAIKFEEWNLKVVTETIPFPVNKTTNMVINNFGITGSNCCLILSQLPKQQVSNTYKSKADIELQSVVKRNYLIPFSANSFKSLQQYQNEFGDLQMDEQCSFDEYVNNQILLKPKQLVQRSVIIASDWNEFTSKSNVTNTSNENLTLNMSLSSNKKNATMVFVFCGQGSQYVTMGKQLYDTEPIFRNSMDLIDGKLSKYYGYSILNKLISIEENDTHSINDQDVAQPSTCMIQISLFELYKHWGIEPSFLLGHSLGEISAAYCSGMLDLDNFCYLIYHRSTIQSKTNGLGKMLSIGISKQDYLSTYSSNYPTIEIACYNSSSSIVIAGDESSLYEISKDLVKNGKLSTMLGSLSSFHTSSQLLIKDDILNLTIKSQPPKIPTFSTTTTNLFSSSQPSPFNSEYVFDNIVKPVLFEETISNFYNHIELNDLGKDVIFIEIAPHPTLQYHLKQMVPKNSKYFSNSNESITVYSPLSKKLSNDLLGIQQIISKLYCQGYSGIKFECQLSNGEFKKEVNNNINLPLYQWDDNEYWKIDSSFQQNLDNGSPVDILGHSNSMNSPLFKSYQTVIDTKSSVFQWIKGHVVNGMCCFPGFGYIHNILKLNVGGTNVEQPNITISFIDFKAPLVLADGTKTCLQTNIYQTGKKEFKALFHYKDKKTDSWVHSSSANYQLFNVCNSGNEIKYDINDIISIQCNLTKLSKSELYYFIKNKICINYLGAFQGVQECYLGDDCALSIVSLDSFDNDKLPSSFFNTSIMDSCLHGAVGLIDYQCQIVLEKVEGLTYYYSRIPKDRSQNQNVYVYSKKNSRFGDNFSFSIVVLLIDGTVLYEIDNVICTSTIPIKDSLTIEYPTNQLYSKYYQPKDTPLSTPSSFDNIYKQDQSIVNPDKINNINFFISTLFYDNIIPRCPELTIDQITIKGIDKLKSTYCNGKDVIYQRLFTFVFETIIQYYDTSLLFNQLDASKIENYQILLKSTKIISKLLFPIDNEDKSVDISQSLFEDGLLEQVYTSKNYVHSQNKIVADIIKQSVKQLLNEKMVFRILEFGGGVGSLSLLVLEQINSLLNDNPHYQIDIEYTWSDISPSFIPDAKVKFSKYNQRINIIYKTLNLEKPLVGDTEKELNPQYYDFVIMSNVLHVIKDVKYGVDQIYKVLTPNGHLLFVEPKYKSLIGDTIFGVFDQWWSFEDTNIRQDRCCMKQETWNNLLLSCNFINDVKMSNNLDSICFVIQAQKPSLLLQPLVSETYDNIIIFKDDMDEPASIKFMELFSSTENIQIISNIQQFKDISITNSSIIYFIKSLNQLNVGNFKQVTYEFIQLNQILLELNIHCKIILATRDSQSSNYLSSSLFGVARYFEKDITFQRKIQMYTLNFDSISLIEKTNLGKTIESLISSNLHIQREFKIEKGQVYFERLKCESKLKNSFKSDSFEQLEDRDKFMVSLSPNLQYQLETKPNKLNPNEVEVQVIATGLNYKDYLIYAGLLPKEMVNHNGDISKPEFGSDFSGIITRMGSNATKKGDYKIGDHVYGISINTTSSHTITHMDYIFKKPMNISHVEASSIPVVYITSYHSLYNIGGLRNEESILIHSATGGVGLSTLEILKWMKHTGLIFCTVGSIEKEQYLLDSYGDMITGIYSTRNKDYVNQIKLKVKQLNGGSSGGGIDLVLNTLSSSDYMDSNFKCLNAGGRIVDLSITHLNSNEYTENKKFKYNYGYHNVELLFISKILFNNTFKVISRAIQNGQLNYKIPVIEYSNVQVKEAIEFINQRKHIGKVVINHETNNIVDKLIDEKLQDNHCTSFTNLKSDYHIKPSVLGKNIIITGQSGIVLEILKWILRYSVAGSIENIIILSKSSIKWELELLINKTTRSTLNGNSIKFHFKSVDIGDTELVDKTISDILSDNPTITNIDSIFHYAFSQIACQPNDIDLQHLNISHGAKVMGAINLHEQSIQRGWKLTNFIMASSIASVIGSTDQCGYVSANIILDSLSVYRKSIGLPSICTNYGLIQSTGFVYRNESIGAMLGGEGLNPLSTNSILGSLDLQLQNQSQSTNLLFCDFNFESLISYGDSLSKFGYQINLIKQNRKVVFKFKSVEKVKESILNKISELISIDESKINQDIKLVDYGADSMLIVNLKNYCDKEFQLPLSITIQQINNNTIKDFIQFISNEFDKQK